MTGVPQPAGTVTLVFTDIEGSTRLLDELGTSAYRDVLDAHRRVLREACAHYGGYEVDQEGDAFFYAFASAQAAVDAVSEAMLGLAPGPIRIRVGIHTGEPDLDPPKYVGMDVHRAARIMSCAHGGQVLLGASTVALLEPGSLQLRGLGRHRLKDLSQPIELHQLLVDGLPSEFPPPRTLYSSNLPVPATRFLGREQELAGVVELLLDPDARLLTLTGPGGTGKTRLALEAAAEVSDSFPDGVYWVPLAPLHDPELVLPAVAQTLAVREQPDEELLVTLARAQESARRLLLLDNAEHLLPGAATAIADLTGRCPSVRLLVTSRERLRVRGETTVPVPPLSAADGVRLFVERARAAGVEIEEDETLTQLCSRLDELPLAIELAAARSAVLTPGELLERLSDRLDLLQGARDADPRQQTLRATIDWSYRLLDPEEQRAHRSLSVFPGGCTVATAEEVAGADLDVIQSLLDKSLLRRREADLGTRFWMLETIREHAGEQLSTDDLDAVQRRLVEHFAAVVMPLAQERRAWEQPRWLTDEAANLRLALDLLETEGDGVRFGWLVCGLAVWWAWQGLPAEGLSRCEAALGFPGLPDTLRAELLERSAELAGLLYDDGAIAPAKQALELFRALGDVRGVSLCLDLLSETEIVHGDSEAAEKLIREALELAIEEGDSDHIAVTRVHLARILAIRRDLDGALAELHPAVEYMRARRIPGLSAIALASLADLELRRGAIRDAVGRAREALDDVEDAPGVTLWILATLAAAAFREGQRERAARLLGASEMLRRRQGLPASALDDARGLVPLAGLDDAFAEGNAMTSEQAIAYALSDD